MTTHELKCDETHFEGVWQGLKPFEVRRNDRDFQPGDRLLLRESWREGTATHYTGRWVKKDVIYVLRDGEQYGVMPGFVVLGLSAWNERWPEPARGTERPVASRQAFDPAGEPGPALRKGHSDPRENRP